MLTIQKDFDKQKMYEVIKLFQYETTHISILSRINRFLPRQCIYFFVLRIRNFGEDCMSVIQTIGR